MKRTDISVLSLGCCWMLSPESLALVGNIAGQAGWAILIPLALVTLCFMTCAHLLSNRHLPEQGFPFHKKNTASIIGANGLTLAASLPLMIFSATAILVTAGYTFNEVFLYWFPNFGFAFLLLFLLTVLQFFPEKITSGAQVLFIGTAVIGLLFLSFYGILSLGLSVSAKIVPGQDLPLNAPQLSWHAAALLPLLYVGTLFPEEQQKTSAQILIPAVGFSLFLLWIAASLNHVSPERLASSDIPYMTAARKIMGEPGRYIMGVIIIAGSCGAVNGFFVLCRRILTGLADQKTQNLAAHKKISRSQLLPLALATCIGGAMAAGLAGEDLLEVLVRAALLLWLTSMILRCIAALLWLHQKKGMLSVPALLSTVLLAITLPSILFGDPEKVQLVLCIFFALSAGLLMAACRFFINKHSRKEKGA
ncbi:MAG: hypothetical protein D3925_06225 [Candidatus Electrothrix sp. AR5]|nr:hypothetical protein [Candidatus Electrothrix sp. AR5]